MQLAEPHREQVPSLSRATELGPRFQLHRLRRTLPKVREPSRAQQVDGFQVMDELTVRRNEACD